jgi:uncharacterized membrane protein (DUF485 family)
MDELYARIHADPEFRALQRARERLCWLLAASMFVAFFAFILVIAFVPALLAVPLGPDTVITRGIPLGVGVILLGFVLTGIYVWRANGEFDRRNAALVRRFSTPD